MSRIPKLNMREERYLRAISAWTDERDPAAEAEIDAIIIAIQQKQAIARERAIAVRTPPLPNVRPVMPTPTASSPALPIERVAEYLHSDPNGPEIKLASMIVDQQLEAKAAVAGAARMKADEERAAVSAAAANRPIHDWSDEALDAQIRSEINARQIEEEAIVRQRAIAAHTPPRPVMPTPTASSPALPIERVAEYLPSDPRKTARPAEVQAEEDEEFPFDAATTLAPSLVPASQPLAEEEPVVRSDVEQTPNEGSEQEFVRALDLRGTKGEHFR